MKRSFHKYVAVIALVAMLLTLFPASIFAVTTPYSSAASRVTGIDPDNPKVSEKSTFTLRFHDGTSYLEEETVKFYVESSRDAETVEIHPDYADNLLTLEKNTTEEVWAFTAATDENGRLKFTVKSPVPGEVTIKVGRTFSNGEVINLLTDGTRKLTIGDADIDKPELTVPGEIEAGDRVTLNALVEAGNFPVEGKEVTFYEREEGRRWVNIGSKKTDNNGEAKLDIRREKAGNYEYYARVNSKNSDEASLTVIAGQPFSISADKSSVSVEKSKTEKIKFIIKDRYANKYDNDALEYHENSLANAYRVMEVTLTKPDGDEVSLNKQADIKIDDDKFYIEHNFKDAGTYKVEAFIVGTSISAATTVNVGIFTNVARVEVEADEAMRARQDNESVDDVLLIEEANYSEIKIYLYDTEGIKKDALVDEVAVSSSNRTLASIHREDGKYYAVAGREASGEVTITVTDLDSGLEGSVDIYVAGSPISFLVNFTADPGMLVGEVTLTYVDNNLNKTMLTGDEEKSYRVIVPAGVDYFDREDFEEGEVSASFGLRADDFGTYSIRVISDLGISRTFDVVFSEEPVDPVVTSVKMFIDSRAFMANGSVEQMDVAPFIEGDRTFVPVRFIAQAFGVEEDDIDWEPRTGGVQKVFINRGGVAITITIGSNTIEVIENGEETEVIADVPAFIREGRTFLPLRAIGEIFGAEFDWGPRVGATQWVSFTM